MKNGRGTNLIARGGTASAVSGRLLRENAILRHLETAEAERLADAATLIEMPAHFFIYGAGQTIDDVYFPIDSILSIVTNMRGGETIEVGTIGREGTSGIPLLLGGTTTANDCY